MNAAVKAAVRTVDMDASRNKAQVAKPEYKIRLTLKESYYADRQLRCLGDKGKKVTLTYLCCVL